MSEAIAAKLVGNFDTGIASGVISAAGDIYGNYDTNIASGTNSWVEDCGLRNSDLILQPLDYRAAGGPAS